MAAQFRHGGRTQRKADPKFDAWLTSPWGITTDPQTPTSCRPPLLRPPRVLSGPHFHPRTFKFVHAAHSTNASTAIGMILVTPKNMSIKNKDRAAPALLNHRHELNGSQIPVTANAESANSPALVTAMKKPDTGKPEDAVITPSGPESPSAQGQAQRNNLPNVCCAF